MSKHVELSDDDVKFLTELANEMKTQDCMGTAKPVIFEVMETKKRIGADPAYADGMVLVLEDHSFFEEEVDDAKQFLQREYFDDSEPLGLKCVQDLTGLVEFCDANGIDDYHYTGYEFDREFSGPFLTRTACERQGGAT